MMSAICSSTMRHTPAAHSLALMPSCARARGRHRAAAALRDLQAVPVAQLAQRAVQPLQVAAHDGTEVGVERGGGDALVLAPFRRDVERGGDEELRRDRLHQRLYAV